jgi:antitoxin VapB
MFGTRLPALLEELTEALVAWYLPKIDIILGCARNDREGKDTGRSESHRQIVHARPQSGGAPKEYRFEGKEVRISKIGDKVILEPLEKPPFDVEAWRAELDALGAADFLPDGLPDDPPWRPDPRVHRLGEWSNEWERQKEVEGKGHRENLHAWP